MFSQLLNLIDQFSVAESELHQPISFYEVTGEPATLQDLINQSKDSSGSESLNAGNNNKIKRITNLSEREMEIVVEARLQNMPSNYKLAFIGVGEFGAEELRREVKNRTEVGKRYMGSVMRDCAFLEQAAEVGKISVHKTSKDKVSVSPTNPFLNSKIA
jgi:hypothetical protein